MRKLFLLVCALFFIQLASAVTLTTNATYSINSTHDLNAVDGILFFATANNTLQNISRSPIDTAPFCIVIDGRSNATLVNTTWVANQCVANINLTAGTLYRIGTGANATVYNISYNNTINVFPTLPVVYPGYGNFTGGCYSADCGIYAINSTVYSITNLSFGSSSTLAVLVTLNSPADATIFNNRTVVLNASVTPTGMNITNATLFVFNATGGIYNKTNNTLTGNMTNTTTWTLNNIPLGDYSWNVFGCIGNTSTTLCTFATNRTFIIGATFFNQTYSQVVYETAYETYSIGVDLTSGASLATAFLVYNGTNYSVSNISTFGSRYILTKSIDVPTLRTNLTNETRNFYWSFLFSNSQQATQVSTTIQQNVTYVNLQICDATYNGQVLNFTLYDEINQTRINATVNPTSFESSWSYWIGGGGTYRNYSFQNLTSAQNNYRLCIFPNATNITFRANSDIAYSAASFRENQYHLTNATLTNATSNIFLYLLNDDIAQKFFLTFVQGTTNLANSVVTVEKFFTGLGQFITVSILETDDTGQATMWQQVDANYRYSVVQSGSFLGQKERESICAVAPCALTIILDSPTTNPQDQYYGDFAQGIVSNMSYNNNTQVITYNFLDTTGLAQYFRLQVQKIQYNQTGQIVCDSQLFSPAGSLSCNLTGYQGEFKATGFISRSPEKVDQVLNVITDDDALQSLGLMGIFLVMAAIITATFAGAVITKGSPSGVLYSLGGTILLLKLSTIFPFTWTIVSVIEAVIMFMIWKVKV